MIQQSRHDGRPASYIALLTVALIASVAYGGYRVLHTAQPGPGAQLSFAKGAAINPRLDPRGHESQARRQEVEQRFSQAVAMLNAREYEHAVTALHRVLELNPTLVEAHVNMGYALLGLGQNKAALDFFQGAVDLNPAQANAYYGMALVLAAAGDLSHAQAAMENYLRLTPTGDPYRRKAEAALASWREGRGVK